MRWMAIVVVLVACAGTRGQTTQPASTQPNNAETSKIKIVKSYDRFQDITKYSADSSKLVCSKPEFRLIMGISTFIPGDDPSKRPGFYLWDISILMRPNEFGFRQDHSPSMILILDNKTRLIIGGGEKTHYHVTALDRIIDEFFALELSPEEIEKIGDAKKVEGQFINYEFELTKAQIAVLKKMAQIGRN